MTAEFFNKLSALVTLKRALVVLAVVLLASLAFASLSSWRGATYETVAVTRGAIVEEVSANGRVEPEGSVNLSFQSGGRVQNVFVSVGDAVAPGDLLVQLESGTLSDQLSRAQAELSISRSQGGRSEISLERVRAEQDALVENAYRKLLSEGLSAVPERRRDGLVVPSPAISGLYTGEPGTYKLIARREMYDGTLRSVLFVFDLERTAAVPINAGEPVPIGTRGLFATFPGNMDLQEDLVWYLTIPNAASAAYAANYSAYRQALETRARIIAEAEAAIRAGNGGASVAEASVSAARAEVARVEREMSERTLMTTFGGVVARVEARPGETVLPGQTIVSVMPEGVLQVAVNVSENNIVNVRVGQKARIILDAFGREAWEGVVAKIDPAESIIGGAVYYKATVLFDQADPRVRSGMTANVWIETDKRDHALLVPISAVAREGEVEFVLVLADDGEAAKREVVTGLRGTGGLVEIVSGLAEGEEVVVAAAP